MTHERLLELVVQVNGVLTLVSWPYLIYDAPGKSTSTPELKAKLSLRRDQILSAIILDIEESMRPFWPVSRERRSVSETGEELTVLEVPTVLSDDARDAVRDCLAKNERLSVQAARIRGLAGRVSAWDKVTYRCVLCTAVLAFFGLALWFLCQDMSVRLATTAVIMPLVPTVLALGAAAVRQTYHQRANDALIKEEE
jgi:hypothetical protein